jgi:hypothetical protein
VRMPAQLSGCASCLLTCAGPEGNSQQGTATTAIMAATCIVACLLLFGAAAHAQVLPSAVSRQTSSLPCLHATTPPASFMESVAASSCVHAAQNQSGKARHCLWA